jgi:hypothetical protein
MELVVSNVIQMLREDSTLETLLKAYNLISRVSKHDRNVEKLRAELCFLIAREYSRTGEWKKSRKFAEESVAIYRRLKVDTLESAIPILDWLLPDYMHEGVVKKLKSAP